VCRMGPAKTEQPATLWGAAPLCRPGAEATTDLLPAWWLPTQQAGAGSPCLRGAAPWASAADQRKCQQGEQRRLAAGSGAGAAVFDFGEEQALHPLSIIGNVGLAEG
jgi:hypothetical protein